MSEYNHYRGSIYHCIESGSEIEPIYIEDGLMVVDVDSGNIVKVGSFDELFQNGQMLIHQRILRIV